jgi:hypothetical protein
MQLRQLTDLTIVTLNYINLTACLCHGEPNKLSRMGHMSLNLTRILALECDNAKT